MSLRLGILLCVVAACDDDTSGAADAAAPDLAGCPVSASMGDPCPVPGLSCSYGSTICECDSVFRCRSLSCPAAPTPGILGSCDEPGLYCDYPGEAGCQCLAPEREWLCCGPTFLTACPTSLSQAGSYCCGITPPTNPCIVDCHGGMGAFCWCKGNHWSCQAHACSSDLGADM